MKRTGYIFEKIVSIENCKLAIINAAKHKKGRKNVAKILKNLDERAEELSRKLKNGEFISEYSIKEICDGLSGKYREIAVPKFFPDQCAHHAIMQILMPIIERSSYYWSCANMRNRGIKRACIGVERATKRNQKNAKYAVQMDIRHFYPTIPHKAIKDALRRKIKDEKALALFDLLIDSYHSDEGENRGVPIGNYTSPWFVELVLQPLDHMIIGDESVVQYVRYADDMVIIGKNKKKLRAVMFKVIDWVKANGMEIKGNYQLYRIMRDKNKKGRKIDFVGRCFGRGFTTIRKRTALACMRQSRRIKRKQEAKEPIDFTSAAGFLSRTSCALHTQSYGFRKKYVHTININDLKEVVRNESKRRLVA